MMHAHAGRAVLGGLVATTLMTALVYAAPLMGLPLLDIAALLGRFADGIDLPPPGSASWWFGMLWHCFNGIVLFPLLYSIVAYRMLPGAPWVRGVLWGVALYLLAMLVALPLLGVGVFAADHPLPLVVSGTFFFSHLLYGGALGGVAGADDAVARPARRVQPRPSGRHA